MLKKSVSIVAVLAFLTVTAPLLAAEKPFGVSVSIKGTETPNQVEFDVVVKDSTSKVEVFAPKVLTTWGEPAKANSIDKEGREFSFLVVFEKGGKVGTYELIVTKNRKEIQKDHGVFSAVDASVSAAGKPFSVTVSFKDTKTVNQVEFDVVVADSTTNVKAFAPKVITTWGEPAKANSMDKEGREFSFSVVFDKGGKAGTYELIVTKNGKEIQKDEGTFSRK